MHIDVVAPIVLTLAIASSWRRTLLIFDSEMSASFSRSPLTMIATAISLSGFGLAFADHGLWLGSLIAIVSIAVATGIRDLTAVVVVLISTACFSSYLWLTCCL